MEGVHRRDRPALTEPHVFRDTDRDVTESVLGPHRVCLDTKQRLNCRTLLSLLFRPSLYQRGRPDDVGMTLILLSDSYIKPIFNDKGTWVSYKSFFKPEQLKPPIPRTEDTR